MNEAARTALDATPESMQPGVPQADAGFLWDFWYPAMRSDEIYGKHLATAMLLEVPLVIGRTSEGKAFAMRDACPTGGFRSPTGTLTERICSAAITGGVRRVQRAVCADTVADEP